MSDIRKLVDDLYKQQAVRLHAVLIRLFGTQNLDLAEDVLHDAFNKALEHWQDKGVPDNPVAWIFSTARNQAIDTIRVNKTRVALSSDLSHLLESEWSLSATVQSEFSDANIKDDQLRMIFMCCREEIKAENRIPFILRTLCGLSIAAIARAMVLTEATVKKRLLRTREKLRAYPFDLPSKEKLGDAMDSVHTVLYLLFNEGFHSSDNQRATNIMLCREAIGLVSLLIDDLTLVNRDTLALYALMHFHLARFDAKCDANGYPIPIDLQDRQQWKQSDIAKAEKILGAAKNAPLGASARFFIEACIAREHCRAESFAQTDWPAIVGYYAALVDVIRSPLAMLNHAIALAHAGEIEDAIARVEKLKTAKLFKNSHIPTATLAYLYAKAGDMARALANADMAKKCGGTPFEQKVMMQQITRLLDDHAS